MSVRSHRSAVLLSLGRAASAAAQQHGAIAGIRGRVVDLQGRGVAARVQIVHRAPDSSARPVRIRRATSA